MKRLIAATIAAGVLGFAAVGTAFAEPTVDQVFTAARNGHLDEAQQMMNQVLAAHPESAKAHYVQAELYAREGKYTEARSELGTAERLKPGLPFESERSVQELKGQLGLRPGGNNSMMMMHPASAAPHFPWVAILVVVGAIALLFMVFRRRSYPQPYPAAGQGPGGTYGPGGAPPYGGYGPGYGPGPGGGGIGSGIAGGLASGLAVGAGVVAGEELAHHFLDGNHPSGGVIPAAEAEEPRYGNNNDMGGNDFGMNDPGSGWDDSGGGGGFDGGGGGDWS